MEVVERMVGTIRHHYGEVIFIVPPISAQPLPGVTISR